jgi:transcriptional regulator GlxA family with amidase domain
VIDEMDKRIERPVSCAHLASTVNLSPRQLERLFQRHFGSTPTQYYLEMRLNRARQLVRQTSMPIMSVGVVCGFTSGSHLARCYNAQFGRTPSEERRRMRAAHSAAATMPSPNCLAPATYGPSVPAEP